MDRAQLAAWSSSAGPGSQSMLAAIARALRLTRDERDHLFHLAGHTVPDRSRRSDHVNPALLHVLDRLDTPAQVMSDLGWTLVQNPMAVALLGDQTRHVGPARSIIHRFFLDPEERWIYPPEDHEHHARLFTAGLRAATSRGPDAQAAALAEELRAGSPEFARL